MQLKLHSLKYFCIFIIVDLYFVISSHFNYQFGNFILLILILFILLFIKLYIDLFITIDLFFNFHCSVNLPS